ncbi:hypothetical protein AB0D71_20565 [Streptomyces avermitilis]|uniref:hypothetical protein n=1 Tax=Streptomyces avermitilis TaxID=33903 RepID=UPI0034052D6B
MAPELQPFRRDLKGELVQSAGAAINGRAPVADVEIVELEAADRRRPCRVDRGEGEDQPVGGVGDGGYGTVDVLGLQGLDDAFLTLADLDAAGRTLEDGAVLLGPGEQGPQGDDGVLPLRAPQGFEVGEYVVAGDFGGRYDGPGPARNCRGERPHRCEDP